MEPRTSGPQLHREPTGWHESATPTYQNGCGIQCKAATGQTRKARRGKGRGLVFELRMALRMERESATPADSASQGAVEGAKALRSAWVAAAHRAALLLSARKSRRSLETPDAINANAPGVALPLTKFTHVHNVDTNDQHFQWIDG